ncbi:hypothetical protein [Streptomyces spiralis]|uniref:hypothetical protein n=1 Tax=Streptomyces spiralis TaxID=66376 RepID=UPI0036838FC4
MLPSDAGSGAGDEPSPSLSGMAGMFAATGAAAVGAAAALAAEYTSFTEFKKRVDDLIHDLKGSEAGPGKVGRGRLARHEFGGGGGEWSEAAGLYTAYETVVSELETLSKLLSDSMEGMGIAVVASHKGYQNIDIDVRRRMAAISAETTEHYGGTYDPPLPRKTHAEGDAGAGTELRTGQPPTGDSGGTI